MLWAEHRHCLGRHRRRLFRLGNVVGSGLGYKWVKGQPTLVRAVRVLVRQKLSPRQLRARDLVPPHLDGIPTDVLEVGDVRLLGHAAPGGGSSTNGTDESPDDALRRERVRPACGGVSVANYLVTAGTLGALVVDDETGLLCILSNNHVLANSSDGEDGRAFPGDPILQPGPFDGGTDPADRIATLGKFIPLKGGEVENRVDAALGVLLSADDVVPNLLGLGIPGGKAPGRMGMPVVISGRTSGVRKGSIVAMEVTVDVGMATGVTARFVNQIATTPVAQPGDSGSLVVDSSLRAVGLLFAGSSQISLANPIDAVFDLLGVTLV